MLIFILSRILFVVSFLDDPYLQFITVNNLSCSNICGYKTIFYVIKDYFGNMGLVYQSGLFLGNSFPYQADMALLSVKFPFLLILTLQRRTSLIKLTWPCYQLIPFLGNIDPVAPNLLDQADMVLVSVNSVSW